MNWGEVRRKYPGEAAYCLYLDEIPDDFECDGCSTSPDHFWAPSTKRPFIVRLPIVVACMGHDWHYRTHPLGSGWLAKSQADKIFAINIVALGLYHHVPRRAAKSIAWLYAGRVKVWGDEAWTHEPSKLRRIAEVWGLTD